MHRRSVLAAVLSVGLAGCSALTGADDDGHEEPHERCSIVVESVDDRSEDTTVVDAEAEGLLDVAVVERAFDTTDPVEVTDETRSEYEEFVSAFEGLDAPDTYPYVDHDGTVLRFSRLCHT